MLLFYNFKNQKSFKISLHEGLHKIIWLEWGNLPIMINSKAAALDEKSLNKGLKFKRRKKNKIWARSFQAIFYKRILKAQVQWRDGGGQL